MGPLENPDFCRGDILGVGGVPFLGDDARFVLLDDFQLGGLVALRVQPAQIPEAAILPVPEQVLASAFGHLLARFDLRLDLLARGAGLRGELVVEDREDAGHHQTHGNQGEENPVETHPCAEHGDDLIAPGHLGQRVEECKQKTHRNTQDNDTGNLEQIVPGNQRKGGMAREKIGEIDAQIPYQPDRDEPGDAVEKGQQKLIEEIPVENRHGSLRQKPVAGGRKEKDSDPSPPYPAIAITCLSVIPSNQPIHDFHQ